MRFRPLIRLLSRNHIAWTPQHSARILFLLQSSCWSSLFSRIETMRFGSSLQNTPVPRDPIFIVGHWRTGSTLLHQLMAQDPELTAPTLFQVALPENFLVSYHFYKPILSSLVGSSRPMDNVKIGMDEPQEDEYAIFRLTTRSPLEQLIFPAKKEYFLNKTSFLPAGKSLLQWESRLKHFYRKIYVATGKRIVSKNPFNSLRIPLLAKLFPEARFIHIVRHPFAVVPSTQHLWRVVQKQNILNRNGYIPDAKEIAEFLLHMTDTIQDDFTQLPGERSAEIRYEDLVQNPVASLQSLYQHLKMSYSGEFESLLTQYISSLAGYRKNVYSLSDVEKNLIAAIMNTQLERYGYIEKV